ncbi:MAG TPA: recombinase family protein [Bryobacteraceae bacterium]|jgi:DNA invertase Pin-like site-specific DNA recombinase|nr:recombinase family protein [Bryobacteraceae bacterium]
MRAIGYARVSTDKQADGGVSLDAQQEKIRAMAVVHGSQLQDVIVDAGESAKTLDRPGMERLLALVDARKVDVVIVAKLDRLTRSVKDLASLLERFTRRGVALVSVAESLDTSTAAGRLVLNIMVSVSQWEREAIGERTRDAMAHMKTTRQVYSPTPYGFERIGDVLTTAGDELRTVEQIREWHSAGWTLRAIASELNRLGIATKNGGAAWYASTIRGILTNRLHTAAA